MKYLLLLHAFLIASLSPSLSQIDNLRVEPPNWWIGMKNTELQILLYEKDVDLSHYQIKVDHAQVSLERSTAVANPHYLFLSLKIHPDAQVGIVPILFFEAEEQVYRYDFELLSRESDAAHVDGFNSSDVIYLITPDRFANGNPDNDNIAGMKEQANRSFKGGRHGGDIQGIQNHLDYIKDLGFTAVWVNPVLENDMEKYSYHGYAATDFYQVDRRFGSNEEYKALCSAANEKGLKVIMDMIMNHSGSEHWFVLDPPTPDWINHQDNFTQTSHKRNTIQDIHASDYDKKAFSDGWFVKTMPDLNQRNELMATYLIQNTIWWIEYAGLSGIRMDTYPYPDKDFMTDWTCAVMEEYPNFNIVGEEWTVRPAVVSYWQAGKVNHDGYHSCLPSVMDFPLQHAITNALLNKENWNSGWIEAYEMLAMDFLYADPDNLVIFPDNHDMARFITQINNDYDLFQMGMVYFATMRGIPQFYYGTEILMNSNENPGDHGIIRTDFPGGWPEDKVNALTGAGLSQEQKDAQAFTKKLLNWRKDKIAIHEGHLIQFAPENGIYAYVRQHTTGDVMVIFNKTDEAIDQPLAKFDECLKGRTVATDVLENQRIKLGKTLRLAPKSAIVLELEGKRPNRF